MELRVGDKAVQGVGLVRCSPRGRPLDQGPEAQQALAMDALVLQDASGQHYRAYKAGLHNVDQMYQPRGSTVVVGGQVFTSVKNINEADTPQEKPNGKVSGFLHAVGFHAKALYLRAYEAVERWVNGASNFGV